MAKSLGDILVVCLSNDEQVRKLKGPTRPVNNYDDRINLFKTISYVDYIVLYSESNIETEETLDQIMKTVNPAIWVKGDEYTESKIREKHPSLKKIVLIPTVENKSTTNIIKKIENLNPIVK
jgi:D-beta-D-heptose 7-phosphate kinase/D-beta-D-heptose 1-phosphate adenosyltransferase